MTNKEIEKIIESLSTNILNVRTVEREDYPKLAEFFARARRVIDYYGRSLRGLEQKASVDDLRVDKDDVRKLKALINEAAKKAERSLIRILIAEETILRTMIAGSGVSYELLQAYDETPDIGEIESKGKAGI